MGPVGVVGASARAAVMSLARAGFSAWAVDLFADRDLRRVAPCGRCPFDRYPDALPELCDPFPPGPVLYTGGLENHPEVVRELARRRPLWGNDPDVLDRVRDPFRLAHSLAGKGFASPTVLPRGDECPASGSWLAKRYRSSGGLGVRVAAPGERPGDDEYLQEALPGPPMSAVFVASHPQCTLLGTQEQLIGTSWLHAGPFHYAGNIGPVELDAGRAGELTLLGHRLMTACELRGVYGVDFIPHNEGAYVIDVNPRYPASAEVIEYTSGAPLLSRHAMAFGDSAGSSQGRRAACPVVGKAIYFAPHRVVFPAAGPWGADLTADFDPWRLPGFADIPAPGDVIEPGWPVLTFFAAGSTAGGCRAKLMERAAELDDLFGRKGDRRAET